MALAGVGRTARAVHVAGDDRRDARGGHGVDDGAHPLHVVVIDDGVDCQIRFYPRAGAFVGNAAQVVKGEVHARARTHVKPLDTEIHGVGAGVDGRPEALVAPHGSHNFKIFSLHDGKVSEKIIKIFLYAELLVILFDSTKRHSTYINFKAFCYGFPDK